MFELMDSYSQNAVIKVLGVGGGGGNAVQHMVEANIEGVEFFKVPARIGTKHPVVESVYVEADHQIRIFQMGQQVFNRVLGESEE